MNATPIIGGIGYAVNRPRPIQPRSI